MNIKTEGNNANNANEVTLYYGTKDPVCKQMIEEDRYFGQNARSKGIDLYSSRDLAVYNLNQETEKFPENESIYLSPAINRLVLDTTELKLFDTSNYINYVLMGAFVEDMLEIPELTGTDSYTEIEKLCDTCDVLIFPKIYNIPYLYNIIHMFLKGYITDSVVESIVEVYKPVLELTKVYSLRTAKASDSIHFVSDEIIDIDELKQTVTQLEHLRAGTAIQNEQARLSAKNSRRNGSYIDELLENQRLYKKYQNN